MRTLDAKHFLLQLTLDGGKVPSFKEYPFSLPVVTTLETIDFHPQVTFLIGENGSGKSTLLEAIAVSMGLNAEGGSRNFHFATRRSHSPLHKFLLLRRGLKRPSTSYFLRAESYFNLATEIERRDRAFSKDPFKIIHTYGNRPLHEQSHGESFFALFENRFYANGLYLLDEPEAALSPSRQIQFLSLLHDHVKAGSQFLIATHSPIIMAYPSAWIYLLGDGAMRRVEYKQTEHFKIAHNFLARPEKMLAELLKDPPDLFNQDGATKSNE